MMWLIVIKYGINLIVFNVGEYRRKAVGANKSHEFFRLDNAEALKLRRCGGHQLESCGVDAYCFLWCRDCAQKALVDVKYFLGEEKGQAAVSVL